MDELTRSPAPSRILYVRISCLLLLATVVVPGAVAQGRAETEVREKTVELDISASWKGWAGGLIAADLNGDGTRDVIVSQPGSPEQLVAYELSGVKLWKRTPDMHLGAIAEDDGLPGRHGPGVQAEDVDDDGQTEVVFVGAEGRLHLLNGATGKTERQVELPPVDAYYDHWEHVVLADFENDQDTDVLLQASADVTGEDYLKGVHIAGYSMPDLLDEETSANALFERYDFHSPGHSVAGVADLDDDGRDEVIGADLIDDDGEKLTSLSLERRSHEHIDSYQFGDIDPDRPGLEVTAAKQGGGNEIVLYDTEGILWKYSEKSGLTDGDKVQIGDFDPDRPGLEIYLRGKESDDQWVLDHGGNKIGDYNFDTQAPDSWTEEGVEDIWNLRWTGADKVLLTGKERHKRGDVGIYDAMDPSRTFRQFDAKTDRLYVADVAGDWREELLAISGNTLHVYQSTAENPNPNRESLWDDRTYRLDRMTWNYYSP